MNKKYTLEEVKNYIENFNYKVLSTEYINNKEKLILQCTNGHVFEMSFHTFKNTGNRCAECNGNKKYTLKEVKDYIKQFDYKLLSTEYINAHTKLKLQCPEGHIFKIRFNNFKNQNQRCSKCNGGIKFTYDYVKNYIEQFDYKLLSTEYKNALTKLKIQCSNGHIFKMRFNDFQQGQRCSLCSYINKSSKPEKDVVKYIKQFYSGIIKENDRTICKNYWSGRNLELDIFLPETRKAIEFNGLYWHSNDRTKWYDEMKKKQCKQKKINLFVINEQDWIDNKEKCLKEIRNFLC